MLYNYLHQWYNNNYKTLHPKDPVPDHQQAGVVYKIPCSDCSKSYIGQTGRTLAQRVK